ncbi:hypothetical protein BgiMline_017611 [Biomphalaria glabrata]
MSSPLSVPSLFPFPVSICSLVKKMHSKTNQPERRCPGERTSYHPHLLPQLQPTVSSYSIQPLDIGKDRRGGRGKGGRGGSGRGGRRWLQMFRIEEKKKCLI